MRRNISNLVNKQIQRWKRNKQTQKVVADTREPAEMPMHSIVTISRQWGSGGEVIAQKVARMLGFKVYDKKIVDEIANKSQMRKTQVESLDERSKHFIEECYRALMLESHFLTSSNYFKHLSEVVLSVAQHGKAVIVGRGAHFILGKKTGLRVRIFASKDTRVERIMKMENVNQRQAIKLIEKNDAEKAAFINMHFGENTDDLRYFDIAINTDQVSFDEAADLIVWLEKKKMSDTTES